MNAKPVVQASQAQDQLHASQQSLGDPLWESLSASSPPAATLQLPESLAILEPWLASLGQSMPAASQAPGAATQKPPGTCAASPQPSSHPADSQPAQQQQTPSQLPAGAKDQPEGSQVGAGGSEIPLGGPERFSAWHPSLRQLAENRATQAPMPHVPVPPRPKAIKGEQTKGGQLDCMPFCVGCVLSSHPVHLSCLLWSGLSKARDIVIFPERASVLETLLVRLGRACSRAATSSRLLCRVQRSQMFTPSYRLCPGVKLSPCPQQIANTMIVLQGLFGHLHRQHQPWAAPAPPNPPSACLPQPLLSPQGLPGWPTPPSQPSPPFLTLLHPPRGPLPKC